jgi:restriction endonuclease S subunit
LEKNSGGNTLKHHSIDQVVLKHSNRWNVEFHMPSTDLMTKSPLGKCSEFYLERKEFADTKLKQDAQVLYIGLENVSKDTGEIVGNIYRKGKEIKSRAKVFQHGDILYSRLRPNLNKVLYWDKPESGICSTEFLVLTPNLELTNGLFFRHLLASEIVQKQISRLITGAALPRLLIDDFGSILLPKVPAEDITEYTKEIGRLLKQRTDYIQSIENLDAHLKRIVTDL